MHEVDLLDEALEVDGLVVQPFFMRMPLVRWLPILLPLVGYLPLLWSHHCCRWYGAGRLAALLACASGDLFRIARL